MSPYPRRTFLTRSWGALGLVPLIAHFHPWQAAGMLPSWIRVGPAVRYALDMLRHSQFDSCLGQAFQVQLEDGARAELHLIEATIQPNASAPTTPSPTEVKRAPFSLVFRGPKGSAWSQRIYRLNHPSLGQLDIFLVPIGPDQEGPRYEAVFN